MSATSHKTPTVPRQLLVPFILVTLLFPLWGFANDITNPMVAAFKNILLLSNFESSLVQAAFYGGYALMAIPAAIFIKKFSYKQGILIGLALYAIGCLLFIPSGMSLTFTPFLMAYLVMTCGLSFLETTANPYVLAMGDESTATRRLNLSQAFNPMGSICGMFVASMFILVNLNGSSEANRRIMLGMAEGRSAHSQILAEQQDTLGKLKEITSKAGWQNRRKELKKASDLAASIAPRLTLLAEPRMEEAAGLQTAIAAQATESKFSAAMNAMAVVLQIRDKVEPSDAEKRRDAYFADDAGLELSQLLGKEKELLASESGFAASQNSMEALSVQADRLSSDLGSLYQTKAGAPQHTDIEEAIGAFETALAETISETAALPDDALKAYHASIGTRFKDIQKSDLSIVVWPYALMGGILFLILGLFAWKLPKDTRGETHGNLDLGGTFRRLVKNERYIEGVIAQTFYVGAQIMCWTFIIQYAELELGLSKSTAQNCNILAMLIFVSSRFICTFLLHYIRPGALLTLLATGGLLLTAGTIFIKGYTGLYCLIGVSACMSLMFPTIYGIALRGLGDDAKLGSAGLILAIGGGCLMPPLQAMIIDMPPFDLRFMELASVRMSFFLPLICFLVIALYGLRTTMAHRRAAA